jgi:hypothetical protein
VISATAAPASNKNFFNMLKSPRVFELNSVNARIHGKIKSWRAVQVKIAREFREAEHVQVMTTGNPPSLAKGLGV